MGFPTTSILDNFNRPDEDPLSGGGAWIAPLFPGWSHLSLVSNEAKRLTSNWGGCLYDTLYNKDQEIYVTITNISGDGRMFMYARLQKPTDPTIGYSLDYYHTYNRLRFARWDSNSYVQLGASVTITLKAGDVVGFRIQGTTFEGFVNGNSVGSRVDSNYQLSGYLAVELHNTSIRIDDFGGGEVVVSGGQAFLKHRTISIPIGVSL